MNHYRSIPRFDFFRTASLVAAAGCLLAGRCWADEPSPWNGAAPLVEDAPSSPAELSARVTDPSIRSLAGSDETVDCGMQSFVFGEKIPIGPADHTPWARPLAGGPLRLTVISELIYNHDIAEIIRRLDCEPTHSVVSPPCFRETFPEAFPGYFTSATLEAIKKAADVLVISPGVRTLSASIADAVEAKVKAGCGLVLLVGARVGGACYVCWPVQPGVPDAWKRSSLIKSATAGYTQVVDHHVTSSAGLFDGVPWAILPPYYLGGVELAHGTEILARDGDRPLAWTGKLGKGRIVALAWGTGYGAFPMDDLGRRALVRDYHDYQASAVIRAILYAAGRSIISPKIEPANVAAGKATLAKITTDLGSAVDLRLRDLQNRTVFSARVVGGNANLPALPAGQYIADLIARDANGASAGWGSNVLNVASPAKLTVTLDKMAYDPGTAAQRSGAD